MITYCLLHERYIPSRSLGICVDRGMAMLGAYRQRLLVSAFAISGLALVGPAAFAADASTPEVVIVTAGKRAEALREVPMAVTAIGGDALENQHLTSFSDFVNHVPGMMFVSSEPGHTTL